MANDCYRCNLHPAPICTRPHLDPMLNTVTALLTNRQVDRQPLTTLVRNSNTRITLKVAQVVYEIVDV